MQPHFEHGQRDCIGKLTNFSDDPAFLLAGGNLTPQRISISTYFDWRTEWTKGQSFHHFFGAGFDCKCAL